MPRRLSYCNFTLSRRKNATLDATSVHLLDGRLTFANGRSGSRLNSTRLNPRPPQCQMLEVPALMARVTPPPSRPCAGTCGYPPARNAAVQVMPPTPGVMVAVERPLAMEKSSSNPPPPSRLCAGTCDAADEDAGVATRASGAVGGGSLEHCSSSRGPSPFFFHVDTATIPPPSRAGVPVVIPPLGTPAFPLLPPLPG